MNKFLDVILSDVKITNITNNFRTNISLKLASNKYHTYKKKKLNVGAKPSALLQTWR